MTQSPWSDNLKVFGLTVAYKTGVGTVTGTTNQYNRTTDFTFRLDARFWCPSIFPCRLKHSSRERAKSTPASCALRAIWILPVNFVAGVYREHESQDLAVRRHHHRRQWSGDRSVQHLQPPRMRWISRVSATPSSGVPTQRSDTQYAGFGEATWKITDAWTAVAGLRYFTETLNGVQTQTHPFGGFPRRARLWCPSLDPSETFNKVTWKGNT